MNKYILQFPHDYGIEYFYVNSDKPSDTLESINIQINFPITNIKPNKFLEWINSFEYYNQKFGYTVGFKKNIILEAKDPTGIIIEKHILMGCAIKFNTAYKSITDVRGLKILLSFDKYKFESEIFVQ